MSFTRTRAPGLWTFNSTVLPGEFEHIDDYCFAIDGKGGGTYAPTSTITIGGNGLNVTGQFDAGNGGIVDIAGSLTILAGAQFSLRGTGQIGIGLPVNVSVSSAAAINWQANSTLQMNVGSTASIAATTTLSGPTTVSGALSISNTIAIASANSIGVSPGRSYTRTCGGAIRYDATKWVPPNALAAAPITLAQGAAVTPGVYAQMAEYRADVPHTSTLFDVAVRVKGGTLLPGLPSTLPTVRVIRTDTTTGATVVVATVTDATLTLVDYQLDHDIVVPIAQPVNRTKFEYLVYIEGDSGSGGAFGTEVSSPRMTYIRGIIGED